MIKTVFRKGVPLTLAAIMCLSSFNLNMTIHAADNKISGVSAKGLSTDGHDAGKVVDGDVSTYWETPTPYDSVNSYKRNVDLDLNGLYDLSKIKVFTDTDKYYQYSIYASTDGVRYNKIAFKENQENGSADGEEYDVSSNEARYLRVNVNFMSGSARQVNVNEIEVYGTLKSKEPVASTQIETTDFKDSEWGKEYEHYESDQEYANQKTIAEAYNLVGRVIGDEWKDFFRFELRENSEDGNDIFEVESKDGIIVVRGNDGVSLAAGFNYYLKNYCKIDYNPLFSSNLTMPSTLPMMESKVSKETLYDLRYALNFCTYSYTMSFWNWDEYEQFIDWAAMNGVNLMLDIIGQEEVQRRLLREYGYSDEEIKDYITGPAYFAWFYMQNMTSYGGPLPDNWFADRVELGRKMHDRMQTFGITPVLEGFAGMVPSDFETKNPLAKIIPSGSWSGYVRPATVQTFLTDNDINNGKEDYFEKVADTFYEVQRDIYGDISNYYAVDPFHEGGDTGDMKEQWSKIYTTMQNRMIHNDADAIWIMQKWGANASVEQLKNLQKEHIVVLDLFSEQSPGAYNMESTDTPWIWNMLHNFGGRMGMFGNPELLASKIPTDMKNYNQMVGIGITPEALNTSPMLWELIFDMTWEQDPINYRQWVNKYIERRYGQSDEDVEAAWDILLNTVYQNKIPNTQGSAETVVNWKPSMDKYSAASTYGHSTTLYDNEEFEKATEYLIKAYPKFKDSETFKYDFIDVLAQEINNSGKKLHEAMRAAYSEKNLGEFDRLSNHFLEMVKLQDLILSTNKEYSVGSWVNKSRKMIQDADDWTKDLFELNARSLITVWGSANNDSLLDYSNRQWSGLTSDLYYKRWESAIKEFRLRIVNGDVNNTNVNSNQYWQMSWEWANKKSDEGNGYSEIPTDYDLAELGQKVNDEYSLASLKSFLTSDVEDTKTNVALGKIVTSSESTDANYPLTNLTDGNQQTDWVQGNVKWPTELTVDLAGTYDVDGMTFKLPQVANDFTIGYEVYVYNDEWSSEPVAQADIATLGGSIRINYFGTASKVKFVFNANALTLTQAASFAELEVYGTLAKNHVRNVALQKPVTTEQIVSENAQKATDGNLTSIASASSSLTGSGSFIVDLQGAYEASKVNVLMEADKPFGFKFKTYVMTENNEWKLIDDQSNNTAPTNQKSSFSTELQDMVIKKVKVEYLGNLTTDTDYWPGLAEIEVTGKEKSVKIENVAISKDVFVSDNLTSTNKEKVVDGNRTSLYGDGNGILAGSKDTGEIIVDLKDTYAAQTVNVVMEAGTDFGFCFNVYAWTGNAWELILDKSNNTKPNREEHVFTIDVKGKNIQKIKVEYLAKTNGEDMWPGLCELEVLAEMPLVEEEEATVPKQNVAYKAPVSANLESNPASMLTDNDFSTIWTTGTAEYPAKATVDIGAEMQVDFTRVYFEANKDSPKGRAFYYIVRGYDKDKQLVFEDDQRDTKEKIIYHDSIVNKQIRYIEVELTGKASFEGAWPAIAEIQAFTPLNNVLTDATITPVDGLEVAKLIDDDTTTGIKTDKDSTELEFNFDKARDIYALELIKGDTKEALRYKVEVQTSGSDKYQLYMDGSKNLEETKKLIASKDKILAEKIRITILNKDMELNEIRLFTYQVTPEVLVYISDLEGKVDAKTIGEKAGNYHQENKDEFKTVIGAIKEEIANTGNMNSDEIEPLRKRAYQAYTNFILEGFVSIDRSPLIGAVESANALKKFVTENGKESLLTEAFHQAFNDAKEIKFADVTQAALNEKAKELHDCIAIIIATLTDVEQYELSLDTAKELLANAVVGEKDGNVSQSTLDTLKTAIETAEAAYADDASKAKELAGTLATAVEAYQSNRVVVSYGQLEALIESINTYDSSLYSKTTWDIVADHWNQAKHVVDAKTSTQKEINTAIDELKKALDDLVVLNKALLQEEVETDLLYNESLYTTQSWSVFHTALSEAQKVLSSVSVEQTDLDIALANLKAAKLQLKVTSTDPETPTEPSEPSEPTKPTEPTEPSNPSSPNIPSTPATPSTPSILPDKTLGEVEDDIQVVGKFLENDRLSVTLHDDLSKQALIQKIKDQDFVSKVNFERIYDINVLRDGKKVSLDGTITIRFKLDRDLMNKNLMVLYIAEDGSIALVPSKIVGNYIEVETTHLSNYAIVSYQGKEAPKPNTGDSSQAGFMLSLFLVSGMGLVLYLKKRKENNSSDEKSN